MISRVLLFVALLLPTAAWAQNNTALPAVAGVPRGSPICQYNSTAVTIGNGGTSALHCKSSGTLLIAHPTAANLNATVVGTGTFLVQAAQSGTWTVVDSSSDPCTFGAKTNVAISTTSGTTQLVAGSSGKKVYVCSAKIIASAAAVINLIEGTGSACVTANEAPVWGSTTAADGESIAANGGFTYGNGLGTVGVTATSANGICLLQSGTVALAGNITYVQQ